METFGELLVRQSRVFRFDQAIERGISRHRIAHDVVAGRSQRLLPAVYVMHTGTPTVHERRQAALLYARDDEAALVLWTAAEVWQFACDRHSTMHVVVTGNVRRHGNSRVRVHRTRHLVADDIAMVNGLRVVAPARTIVDLAPRLDARSLRYLVADAVQRRGVPTEELRSLLDYRLYSPGLGELRRVVRAAPGASTGAELLVAAGLQRRGYDAEPNGWVELPDGRWRQGDVLLRRLRVVVQVESSLYHELLPDIEADVSRDEDWERMGFVTTRTTTRAVEAGVDAVLDRICTLLDRRARELGVV